MAKKQPKQAPSPKPPKPAPKKQPGQQLPSHWHRLDNTANLFPIITSKRGSNVYRFSLNLSVPVQPALLQQAQQEVLPQFKAFKVRLRRGMFWHYLDENMGTPHVRQEDDWPCSVLDPAQNEDFLFRLMYLENRISLEVYHALSDGTGALQFLQAICCRYLILAHPEAFSEEDKARRWFGEHAADTEDSYVQNYTPTKKGTFNIGRGYRIRGERFMLDELSVIHAHLPVKQVLDFCRSKGVSLTQYITACIAWGLYTTQLARRPSKYPVNIFVPVNLRGMFPSTTTLNFFSNIYISLRLDAPNLSFDELLAEVRRQFEEKLSREAMLEKISYTVGSGYHPLIRAVPLPLKALGLRLIYQQGAKSSTLGFSNLGQVKLPAPFAPFVLGAIVLLSTAPQEPFKCSTISCNDDFCVSFTSTLRSTQLQKAIVRRFAQDGLDVTVQTNGVDNESLQ